MSRGLVKVEGTRVGWGLVHVGRAHLRRRLVQVLRLVVWRLVQVLRLLLLQLVLRVRRHVRPWLEPTMAVGSHRLLGRLHVLANTFFAIDLLLLGLLRIMSGRVQVSALFLVFPVFNRSFLLVTRLVPGRG